MIRPVGFNSASKNYGKTEKVAFKGDFRISMFKELAQKQVNLEIELYELRSSLRVLIAEKNTRIANGTADSFFLNEFRKKESTIKAQINKISQQIAYDEETIKGIKMSFM